MERNLCLGRGLSAFGDILESVRKPGTRYIGHTSNLRRRLERHNAGETRRLARDFERYLKSGSGHAFANRHFWN